MQPIGNPEVPSERTKLVDALAAHRPIGSIMRVRKAVYEMAAQFRSNANGVSVDEPTALTSLPA